jgi:hypothetical protein
MPRRAISPSNAPSMRTPPEPLMLPCQIRPEPKHGGNSFDSLYRLGGFSGGGVAFEHGGNFTLKEQGAENAANASLRSLRISTRFTGYRLLLTALPALFILFADICTPMMLKPESTYNTSPVNALERSEARNTAELPTSSMVTFSRMGAISAKCLYISRKPPTPAAANVRIGPPRSHSRESFADRGHTPDSGWMIPVRLWRRPSHCSAAQLSRTEP